MRLLANKIAASVYSATGTAFAATAFVTFTPRRHAYSSPNPLTLPAKWAMSFNLGSWLSTARLMLGHPQLVIKISVFASVFCGALSNDGKGLREASEQSVSSLAICLSCRSSSRTKGCMTSVVAGAGIRAQ